MKFSLLNPHSMVACSPVTVPTLAQLGEQITLSNWAPSIFTGNYRSKANFLSTALLVFDVDEGCTLAEAAEHFGNYVHLIATTRSHQKEKNGVTCDRFRVVLPLSDTITDAATYAATWHHYAKQYPFIDVACKDESRFYYASTEVVSITTSGEVLAVVTPSAPAVVPVVPVVPLGNLTTPPSPGTRGNHLTTPPSPGTRGNLSTRTSLFLANGAGPGTWNSRLLLAAKDMQEQLYTIEEAIERFSTMQNPHFSGELDAADLNTIQSAYRTAPKYAPKITPTEAPRATGPTGNFPRMREGRNGREVIDPIHPENMVHLIQNVLRFSLERNELKGTIEVAGKPLDDLHLSNIRFSAGEYSLAPKTELILDAINHITRDKTYHPFKRALDPIVWDGKNHIATLFDTITIDPEFTEHTETYKSYLYKWLVGVIAKTYSTEDPNGASTQTNMVLTFLGPQGCGKSRWLNKLSIAPNTVNEASISPDDKDARLRLLKFVIWNIAELDSVTRRADAAALKEILTRSTITDRAAYGRLDTTGYNRCSFCASVNDDAFLKDMTGNRRYLTIPVEYMQAEHSVDMLQVFAQAKALWLQGYQYYFDDVETAAVERVNYNFLPTDRIDYIASCVPRGENWVSVQEIFTILDPMLKYNHGDIIKLGALLTRANFPGKRKRTDDPARPQIKKYQTGLTSITDLATSIKKKKVGYDN